MSKKTVAVIMGGDSSERAVSLVTGRAICKNLDQTKYQILPLEMGERGSFTMSSNGKKTPYDLFKNRIRIDIAFIALHGTYGEDGGIQGLLECYGIPYTGSGVLASALCMNKVFSAQVYFANGLPYPEFIHFKKSGWKENKEAIVNDIKEKVGYPLVLKPVDQGSAVGVSIVHNQKELIPAVTKTLRKFPWLMAQKFIKGQEATAGVLERKTKIVTLPPTHIAPKLGKFYDYESKYKKGGSDHICPADFPAGINEEIQKLAFYAHKALGCAGMSRTDFIYADKERKLYILETNTIPGMTPTSLLPEAAMAAGISFEAMLDGIIEATKK